MSIVYNKSMLKPLAVDFEAYKLYGGDQAELIQIRLLAGQVIPMHKNDKEMVFFVLKGEGKLRIEQEELELFEGDCIKVNCDVDREWKNESERSLDILAFKIK